MKWTILFILLFTIFLAIIRIRGCVHEERLIHNHNITSGTIYKYSPGGYKAFSPLFYYSYNVDGVVYYNQQSIYVDNKNASLFINKVILLAYLPDKPDFVRPLITQEDFRELNLIRPDSLAWVDRYIIE